MAEIDPTKPTRKPNKNLQDLAGMVFSRLTVVAFAGRNKEGRIMWRCRCECGTDNVIAAGKHLKNGGAQSCGCIQRENIGRVRRTHGQSRTVEHKIWEGIKSRCGNENCTDARNYIARGITICDRWRNSFESFLADMGKRPSPQHTVERIDNSSGYGPGNCKWATRAEQSRNTRRTRLVTHNGTTLCIRDWATTLGIPYGTLYHYLTHGKTLQEVMASYDQPNTLAKLDSE